jgi:hypothetical protein
MLKKLITAKIFSDLLGVSDETPLSLQRVFHGIRFKVNKDWLSVKMANFFLNRFYLH